MAFIRGTWISGNYNIVLNVDQIVGVAEVDGRAVVYTNAPLRDGSKEFWLVESYQDITNRIAMATGKPLI